MGVPGFFVWLLDNYKNKKNSKIIFDNLDIDIDILYLDSNCLFHPQSFKILDYYPDWDNKDRLEELMIERIINYIEYLVNIVNPKKLLYISVDGVAPMAKINQQRKRRFKSVLDKRIENKIKSKHGKKIPNDWSNISITPGTEFMEKLHKNLESYIFKKKDKIKIIYSSYHVSGEGEHKILQDIKNRNKEDETYMIYGLDADLIFLALSSQKKHLYLLREKIFFNKKDENKNVAIDQDIINEIEEEICFVSINELKKRLNKKIIELVNNKLNGIDKFQFDSKNIDFTDDFIFLCFFLGNDFLPHIPSIDIKTGGLNYLIDNYVKVFIILNEHLIFRNNGNVNINNNFLKIFLKYISRGEDYYFKTILANHKEKISQRKIDTDNEYEKELWNHRNLKTIKINDPIKLGMGYPEDYKFRYYEHYYNVSDYQQNLINDLCLEYLVGIVWVTRYYFESCCSWKWQYPYLHAPFISDLSNYYYVNKINANKINFKESKPISPCVQLLAVLPPQYFYMLPKNYQKLVTSISPIIDYYPININLDYINKDMHWKCIPYVPTICIDRIKNNIKHIKLLKTEKIRNMVTENISNF